MYGSVVLAPAPTAPPQRWRHAVIPVLEDGTPVDWRENLAGAALAEHSGALEAGELDEWFATFSYRRWVGPPELIVDLTRVAARQNEVLLVMRRAVEFAVALRGSDLGVLLGEIDTARKVIGRDRTGATAVVDRASKHSVVTVPVGLSRTLTATTALTATSTGLLVTMGSNSVDATSFEHTGTGLDVFARDGTVHHVEGPDAHLGGVLAGTHEADVVHVTLAAVMGESLTAIEDLAHAALDAKTALRFLVPQVSAEPADW